MSDSILTRKASVKAARKGVLKCVYLLRHIRQDAKNNSNSGVSYAKAEMFAKKALVASIRHLREKQKGSPK